MTLDDIQRTYDAAVAGWRSWERRHAIVQLVRLSELANRANELGDHDLGGKLDLLCDLIAKDIEHTRGKPSA